MIEIDGYILIKLMNRHEKTLTNKNKLTILFLVIM